MKRRVIKNIIIAAAVVALIVAVIRMLGIGDYFSLSYLQQKHPVLVDYVNSHYCMSVLTFILVYIAILATPIPGTAPLTLAGGYLFGTLPGFCYSLFAAVTGATLSLLVSRYVLKRWIVTRYNINVDQFKKKFAAYGAGYLLMLHFLTIVPFSVIVVMATLAEVRLWTFVWTAAVGSTPLFLVYSYAAERFATMQSMNEIFSPSVLMLLVVLLLMAIVPMLVKRYKKDW